MTRIPVYRDDDRKEPVGHADPEGVRAVVREELRALANHLEAGGVRINLAADIYAYLASRAPREPAGEQIAESANCLPPGVPMGYREAANIRECPVCLGIGYFLGKDGGTLGAMRCSACDGRGYFFRTAAPSAQREKGEG